MDEQKARARIGESVDRYQLEAVLGTGGFGAVYRARHTHMGRQVALKLLHPDPPPSAEMQERFLREARAAAAIDERGIVHVYDCGVTAGGEAFLAMEMLDGEDLAAYLTREGAIPPAQAIRFALDILRPLGAAHRAGVVHRDLKPGNVFLASGGVKLLDFGISKLEGEGVAQLTRTGVVMGTPHYMAPETFRGAAQVDHRADLYAVGAMIFEMLAGRPPHDAETYERLVVKVATEPAPSLAWVVPTVSAQLAAAVDRSLVPDPGCRFASADEMARALAPFAGEVERLDSARTEATPSVPPQQAPAPAPPPPETRRGATPEPSPSAALATPQPAPWVPTRPGSGPPPQDWQPQRSGELAPGPPSTGQSRRRRALAIGAVVALAVGLVVAISLPLALDALAGDDEVRTAEAATWAPAPAPVNPSEVAPPPKPRPQVLGAPNPAAPAAPNPAAPTPAAPSPAPPSPAPPSPAPNLAAPNPAPAPFGSAVRVSEPRIVGNLDAGLVHAAAVGRTAAFGRCRDGSFDEVKIQLLVAPGGRISIAQPDPTTAHGPEDKARCAANVMRALRQLPNETGNGIAFITLRL